MASETITTKTDPKEHKNRQKWQEEVSSQLNADAMSSGMVVNQMKSSFDKQSEFQSKATALGSSQVDQLSLVVANTLRTADLFADYLDFIKDVERKRLEAAMEAARLAKDKDKGGGGPGATTKMDGMGFSLGGIAAGLIGALGAGILAFKDSWVGWFSGKDALPGDELKNARAGWFQGLKKFFGFGDEAADIPKAKSGFFFNLKKYFGFEQSFPDELTKKKTGFFDDVAKFLKFGDDAEGTASIKKGNFTKAMNKMMAWAGDTEGLTDAAKKKFFNTQNNMLKWMDKAEDLSLADKQKFLKKQSKMLTWMAEHTDGMDKSKLKFLKDQSKMLKFAEDAEGLSKAAKIKFLKKHADILDIGDDIVDQSKVAKSSFFAKQLKMLGLDPKDLDGVELRKKGMFSKLKSKIFSIADDSVEAISKAKTGFGTKFGSFFKMPMFEEGSTLMKVKTGFLTAIDNIFGTMLKITKGFFKLVNVLNFGALGFLNAEALAHPIKTFDSFKASIGKAFGPKDGIFTKVASTFKAILAPLTDWIKPLKDVLKFVGKIAKVIGKVFIPIGFLFSAFDVITSIIDGYKEGGITGAIGAGIESVFDDVLFAIPNLLGEAVAWILKKFGFENAVEFIDKNLRDKDGNFSLFTGIKKLFTMAVDALYEKVIDPVMEFFKSIPQIIAGMMMDLGVPAWVTKKLFSDETVGRATMERDDPAAYQKMIQAEKTQKKLAQELEDKKRQAASVIQDNKQTTVNNSKVQVLDNRADANSKKDSLKN
jgi:hypothetical protein